MSAPPGPVPGDFVVRLCHPESPENVRTGTGPCCVTRYPDEEAIGPEADWLDRHFARGLAQVRAMQAGVAAWDASNGSIQQLAPHRSR